MGGWGLCGFWVVVWDDVFFFDLYKNKKNVYIKVNILVF